MKLILILTLIITALFASSSSDKRLKKNIAKQLKKEKKFAREQTFYNAKNYDFKGAEVNKDSLKFVPNLEPQDDFDMDNVYD